MTQELYFNIGLIVCILVFTFLILNLIFNFIQDENSIFYMQEISNKKIIEFIWIGTVLSILIGFVWVLFIPTMILYPIIKFIRYINWKKVWKEIGLLGHAARMARDNKY